MKKQVLLLVMVLVMIFYISPVQASTAKQKTKAVENQIKKKYKKVKFVQNNNSKQFWKMIESRKGKPLYYVEKTTGKVINGKKDGKDANGYYISYKRVKGIKKGSRVVSYFVYSRTNNYCDDIVERYDVVIKK